MSKRAIILAGGKGTRLKPYTISLPKPLVPIGTMPILEIIIRQLAKAGFGHVTITINHMADIVKAFFGNGKKWNTLIDYSLENKPLSTMGPLKLIDDLPDDFLVMNGDILTDLDYGDFYDRHAKGNSLFTIGAQTRKQKIEYGVLDTDNGNLTGFREKPVLDYTVSMGIYMVNKEVLQYIPENTAYGFDHLMLKLLDEKKKVRVFQYDGYWLDIGRPDDYEKACDDFEQNGTYL